MTPLAAIVGYAIAAVLAILFVMYALWDDEP